MIRILMLLVIVFSINSSFVEKSYGALKPDWRGGKCAELDDSGNVTQWLSNEVCRKTVGSVLKWDNSTCVEVTPANELIPETHTKRECRCLVGTVYAMSGADFCGEFTPAGTKLRWLSDKNECSVEPGVIKKRCN
jgi:hypothetical protein